MGPAPDAGMSPAGANGHANGAAAAAEPAGTQSGPAKAASFGGAQLLQELHDATHFSIAELGALRERFAAHGARRSVQKAHLFA